MSEPPHVAPRRATPVPRGMRAVLVGVGTASWVAGAVALFLDRNGTGIASLVVAGALCALLGLMGRWPSRVSVSGNEVRWEQVRETVDSSYVAAGDTGAPTAVIGVLQDLEERLDILQHTGRVTEHPAVRYDRAVEAAIRQVMPDAAVIREPNRADYGVADFHVTVGERHLAVETKWRRHPEEPFHGTTLQPLVARLLPEEPLLVVVNATEFSDAQQVLQDTLGDRGRVVGWLDTRDNQLLRDAMMSLLRSLDPS
jgi:hypothetical protein